MKHFVKFRITSTFLVDVPNSNFRSTGIKFNSAVPCRVFLKRGSMDSTELSTVLEVYCRALNRPRRSETSLKVLILTRDNLWKCYLHLEKCLQLIYLYGVMHLKLSGKLFHISRAIANVVCYKIKKAIFHPPLPLLLP